MELTAASVGKFFLFFLFTRTIIQAYLDQRHRKHVWRERLKVPDAFDKVITPENHLKAAEYTIFKLQVGKVFRTVHLIILLAWTFGGGLEYFINLSSDIGARLNFPGPIAQGLILFVLYGMVELLLNLPESIYSTFVVEEKFGFNKNTPKNFALDLLKGILVSAVIGLPFLTLLLWIMTTFTQSWWWIGFLATTALQVILLWAYPTLIAPIFNKFTPLEDGDIKKEIEDLLVKTGIESKGLFVMDASKRTAHGNAYFTGFGDAKRIVFFDTLLKDLTPQEVRAILAHEIGHYKKRHVLKGLAIGIVFSCVGFYVLGLLASWPLFFQGHGIQTVTIGATLLLFSMVSGVYTFFISPMMNKFSRKNEYEADAFASENANAHDLVSALLKLYKENASTLTPDPAYSAFYYSHPPAFDRIKALEGK